MSLRRSTRTNGNASNDVPANNDAPPVRRKGVRATTSRNAPTPSVDNITEIARRRQQVEELLQQQRQQAQTQSQPPPQPQPQLQQMALAPPTSWSIWGMASDELRATSSTEYGVSVWKVPQAARSKLRRDYRPLWGRRVAKECEANSYAHEPQ